MHPLPSRLSHPRSWRVRRKAPPLSVVDADGDVVGSARKSARRKLPSRRRAGLSKRFRCLILMIPRIAKEAPEDVVVGGASAGVAGARGEGTVADQLKPIPIRGMRRAGVGQGSEPPRFREPNPRSRRFSPRT